MKKTSLAAKVLYSAALILMTALLIANPQLCRKAAAEALLICYNLIIPSLFPFMIFSQLLLASPISGALRKVFDRPARRLLGMTGECVSVFVLGSVAGFPVAAKCAERLYRDGAITKNQAERLLGLANNASMAFVISIVGGLILGSLKLGVALYVIQLVSALIAHTVIIVAYRGKDQPQSTAIRHGQRLDLSTVISDATINILTVCGSIVFYTILTRFAGLLLEKYELVNLLFNGFTELSGGVNMLGVMPPQAGFVLASAFICWAGLSIHTQVAVIVRGSGLSMKLYIASKAIQCAAGSALAALYAFLLAPRAVECIALVTPQDVTLGARLQNYYFIYLIAFVMAGAVVLFGKLLYNKQKSR